MRQAQPDKYPDSHLIGKEAPFFPPELTRGEIAERTCANIPKKHMEYMRDMGAAVGINAKEQMMASIDNYLAVHGDLVKENEGDRKIMPSMLHHRLQCLCIQFNVIEGWFARCGMSIFCAMFDDAETSSPHLFDVLYARAKSSGQSISDLVVEALREYLHKKGPIQ